jgi:acyl-CoA synthetase (AMP-forming)/AMP-acid ligase II
MASRTVAAPVFGWKIAIGYGLTEIAPLLTINPPGTGKRGSSPWRMLCNSLPKAFKDLGIASREAPGNTDAQS